MTDSTRDNKPPDRILLATDLSARCDRALDRAAQLAAEWQAELVALNVLDPTASLDRALSRMSGASDAQLELMARHQLAHDLGLANVSASLRTARNTDPAAAIRGVAAELRSELVVTGVASGETFGRLLLGSIVEQLARSLEQPLLVVRRRAGGEYRRILVATDFSTTSRQALLTAAGFFPGRELRLYHAQILAASGLADSTAHSHHSDVDVAECNAFLAGTSLPDGAHVRTVIEHGPVASTLARYVRTQEIDLVVIGSHGRSGLMSVLLGNTAAELLRWLPCDILLVRACAAVSAATSG